MAKRKAAGIKKSKPAANGENGGIVSLTKELFQAAITLRGSVEPADYKRYVLPIIFLRFLSLRYGRRRAELEALVADKKSDYFSLENKYSDKLKGLLPRIYAGSNMDAVSVRGLANLFSKDVFEADYGGDDLIGACTSTSSANSHRARGSAICCRSFSFSRSGKAPRESPSGSPTGESQSK